MRASLTQGASDTLVLGVCYTHPRLITPTSGGAANAANGIITENQTNKQPILSFKNGMLVGVNE